MRCHTEDKEDANSALSKRLYNGGQLENIFWNLNNNQYNWLKNSIRQLYFINLYIRNSWATLEFFHKDALISIDFQQCTWLRPTSWWKICEYQRNSWVYIFPWATIVKSSQKFLISSKKSRSICSSSTKYQLLSVDKQHVLCQRVSSEHFWTCTLISVLIFGLV